MSKPIPSRTQSERSEQTRTRILEAAIAQFSEKGMAGARTDRIAEQAGVNKALLYYYFESKDKLYLAALDRLAGEVRERGMQLIQSEASPGERILRIALAHFDRLLTQREFQSLVHQEMVRLHKGESSAMVLVVEKVFTPVITAFKKLVSEAMASGELIQADWLQVHLAAVGPNILYFLSSPIWQMALDFDPLSAEAVAERRRHMVEFLGQALFVDRAGGAEIAARVLHETPMPAFNNKDLFRGVRDECKK